MTDCKFSRSVWVVLHVGACGAGDHRGHDRGTREGHLGTTVAPEVQQALFVHLLRADRG